MQNHTLTKGQIIDDKYSVSFFLKKGTYAETYRVQNEAKETKFLKLFDFSKLHRTQFTESGDILEIEILKKISHPNIAKYNASGYTMIDNQKFAYVVLDFISGETLADKMKREEKLTSYEAKNIVLSVLNGLNYLHTLPNSVIHNDITIQNIMLDLSGKVEIPKIIDFGYSRFLTQSNKDFLKEGLNLFYTANETLNKVFSVQSDIFSVGALYYHLLTGLPPYFIEISKYKSDKIQLEESILEQRQKPLKFPEHIDGQTQLIISKALQPKSESRFKSVNEFLKILNGDLEVELSVPEEKAQKSYQKEKKKGKGFSAIAGMQELKDTIQLDVIDALNEKERYAEYGLTIPNGMLLYGPPGCGKTFFAERMAEEIGFNFYQIKPSDIQSKWVNASQENIKILFDEARQNAPSIIFIDELDALVPNRDSSSISHMNSTAVNEFLAQMNNSGEDGVFIVGATNRPNAIDPAILRAGRLDKHIYLPPPDFEARKLMFELLMKNRPIEIGLDFEEFADLTENYVSSDLKLICDEAARKALKNKSRITKEVMEETIKKIRPSVSKMEISKYLDIKAQMDGEDSTSNSDRPTIGFKK